MDLEQNNSLNIKKDESDQRLHIGIINLQFTRNYGATIAAAVLENIVREIVSNNYIVDTIHYYGILKGGRFERHKDEAKDIGGWGKLIKNKIRNKLPLLYDENLSIRKSHFETYNKTFVNTTNTIISADLINENAPYIAFIAGSDVIWHPKRANNFRAEGYFLKFAKNNQLKISYAPSIDWKVDKSLKKLENCYRDNLSNLDYISVREPSSAKFLQELTDKNIYTCCDPAFLYNAEDYNEMISLSTITEQERNSNYIYVYILDKNNEVCKYAKKLAKEKNLKIYYHTPCKINFGKNSVDCYSDGPSEFLDRVKNSSYVLTNSFHCIVFSLLFKKQFFSFKRNNVSIKSSELLKQFNLENRLVFTLKNQNIDDYIDFNSVDNIILKMKNQSMDYLKNALSDLTKE